MKSTSNISRFCFLIKILIYLGLVLFILWNISFGFVMGYVLFFAFAASVMLFRKQSLKQTLILVSALILLYLITVPLTMLQYQAQSNKMHRKIQNGQQLGLNEKISIYGLNLIIGIVALPIYPEVAGETLFLCIPARDETRTFKRGFFLKSKKVKAAIQNGKERVVWSGSEFSFGHEESRYALALNPCTLTSFTTPGGTEYMAKVDVRYAKNFEVTLISRPIKISVQEGLFWYLQEINWLHPYQAKWVSAGTK